MHQCFEVYHFGINNQFWLSEIVKLFTADCEQQSSEKHVYTLMNIIYTLCQNTIILEYLAKHLCLASNDYPVPWTDAFINLAPLN